MGIWVRAGPSTPLLSFLLTGLAHWPFSSLSSRHLLTHFPSTFPTGLPLACQSKHSCPSGLRSNCVFSKMPSLSHSETGRGTSASVGEHYPKRDMYLKEEKALSSSKGGPTEWV